MSRKVPQTAFYEPVCECRTSEAVKSCRHSLVVVKAPIRLSSVSGIQIHTRLHDRFVANCVGTQLTRYKSLQFDVRSAEILLATECCTIKGCFAARVGGCEVKCGFGRVLWADFSDFSDLIGESGAPEL